MGKHKNENNESEVNKKSDAIVLAEGLTTLAEAMDKDAEYNKRFEKGNEKFKAIDERIDDVKDEVVKVEKKVIVLAVIQAGLIALSSLAIGGLITYFFTKVGG